MAKRSFTYRFWVSATNEGYDHSWLNRPRYYVPDEIIFTFSQEVEKFVECDNGTFVIKEDDVRFRRPITLKKNIDVLRYQLRNNVRHYLDYCEVDKQDACIVEYELLREDKFSKNEFISDKFRQEVELMVSAINAIEKNPLINHNDGLVAMHFDISLNYVSSEIFSILNKRATSDSPVDARKYLKGFITAFFRLIPKDVIKEYDILYEMREKVRLKNTARDKESGDIICSISPEKRKTYGGKAFALVSRLIHKDLKQEIGHIINCVYKGQKFCFESFASWKKAIIAFLEIDECSTTSEDGKTKDSILNEIISDKRYKRKVEGFLSTIDDYYQIRDIKNGDESSAVFYAFLTVCPSIYLNNKYKRSGSGSKGDKVFNKMEFKNLCLQYFGLKPNQFKPCKCEEFIEKMLNSYDDRLKVWNEIESSYID